MIYQVGRQLGNYRLVRLLGKGGVAEVYLGEHLYLKSQAAIKIVHLTLSEREQSDFLREAQCLAGLKHPHIVRILDFAVEDDVPFLVMEYAPLGNLRTLHPKGTRLPLETIVKYVKQIASALEYLHEQKLVHRDVKPENMLVGENKELLLSDFGIVATAHTTGSLILEGQAGTPAYMAPEQILKTPRPATDQYALGIVVYEWLCGTRPFEGSEYGIIDRHLRTPPPVLHEWLPTISPNIESIVLKALAKNPKERFPTVQAFADALQQAWQKEQPDTTPLALSPASVSAKPSTNFLPPSTLSTLQPDVSKTRRQSPKRSLLLTSLLTFIVTLLLVGLVLAVVHPLPFFGSNPVSTSPTPNLNATAPAQQQALNNELSLEAQTYQKSGIGLSDGRFAFDVYRGRNDLNEKKQAGLAIQQGNWSSAVDLLRKAASEDPTDGEAQIYNEDVHLLQSGASYVTVVLGLPIDGSDADLNRDRSDMQAAFLMQYKVNRANLLPDGLKLRLLIDNSGANTSDVATVAQFVANRVALVGNLDHLIAVVGWPYSRETINARDIIASVHLPLISQTASSVKLTGTNPYFFRVIPADDHQGRALGFLAVKQLHAKTILVLRDQTDSYSDSLADGFIENAKALNATVINNPADYFSESNTTVAQYGKVVADAIANKADLIFMAGFDVDAVRLAVAVGNAYRANPTSDYLRSLKIMGGDGLDTGLVLGQGTGPDAALAAQWPQDMQRLIFSAFGAPDEWAFLKVPQSRWPSFFADWTSTYQSSTVTAAAPGNDAILIYDAVGVIMNAASFVHGTLTGQAIRDALASLGTGKIPAFQGVSGQIHFGADGNPIDKAVVVLQVASVNDSNQIVLLAVVGKFD